MCVGFKKVLRRPIETDRAYRTSLSVVQVHKTKEFFTSTRNKGVAHRRLLDLFRLQDGVPSTCLTEPPWFKTTCVHKASSDFHRVRMFPTEFTCDEDERGASKTRHIGSNIQRKRILRFRGIFLEHRRSEPCLES